MSFKNKLDDEKLIEIYKQETANGPVSKQALATKMGVARTTIIDALHRLAREGRLGTGAVLPGFAIKSTSEQRDDEGNVVKSWVKQGPAGEAFAVPEGHSVKGVSALVDGQGVLTAQWIKTAVDPQKDALEGILEALKEYSGRSEIPPPPETCDSKLLTVYPIVDAHYAMLAWGAETGESWNLSIAEKTILDGIDALITAAPKSKTAIILNLGDFLHTNDATNATQASGHKLDVDGRWRKIARGAFRIHLAIVEKALTKHDEVILEYLSGNHDPDASHVIVAAMEMFFANNPRVKVDKDPSDFFWHRHGQVMIGANHGHKTKASDLPGVMASYRPQDWGLTKFRYCYSGHLHHDQSGEKNGAKWEIFRTVAPKDAYAHSHGYSSGRSMVSITHHDERGEIMRHTVSV